MRARNGESGWMGTWRWRRWGGVIAVATSMIAAAPVQAAGRGAAPATGLADDLGYALGRLAMFGLGTWFIKSLVSRRNDGQRYLTTIEPATPAYSGPRLVGLACGHCRQKIFVPHAAALCRTCNQPVHHLDCRKSHLAGAHEEA